MRVNFLMADNIAPSIATNCRQRLNHAKQVLKLALLLV